MGKEVILNQNYFNMKKQKLIYIAHPIGGDVKNNLDKIKDIYNRISHKYNDIIPFAPYWITCHALDDESLVDRRIGFNQNKYFFENKIIDEMWVYGISNGVNQEIQWCKEFNIPIIYK